MPVKTDRQYRKIDIRNMEAREDQGDMIVEGYATVFDEPYTLWADGGMEVREVIDAHAFDGCDMGDVIFQYDHVGRVFARTRNGTLTITPDERGLHIRANLGGTEIGRQLYEEIKGGYTDRMSFGFTIDREKEERSEDQEGRVTVLSRILGIKKLYDVSAVSLPANDATEISARCRFQGAMERARQEQLEKAEREKKKKQIKILLEVRKNDLR